MLIKYPCPICQYDVDEESKCPECGADWILSAFGVLPGLSDQVLQIKRGLLFVGTLFALISAALLASVVGKNEQRLLPLVSISLFIVSLIGVGILHCLKGVRSPYRVVFYIIVSRFLHASGLVALPVLIWVSLAEGRQTAAWATVVLIVWVGCLVAGSRLLVLSFDRLHYKENYARTPIIRLPLAVCTYLFMTILCGFLLHDLFLSVFGFFVLPVLLAYAQIFNAIHAEMNRRRSFSRF